MRSGVQQDRRQLTRTSLKATLELRKLRCGWGDLSSGSYSSAPTTSITYWSCAEPQGKGACAQGGLSNRCGAEEAWCGGGRGAGAWCLQGSVPSCWPEHNRRATQLHHQLQHPPEKQSQSPGYNGEVGQHHHNHPLPASTAYTCWRACPHSCAPGYAAPKRAPGASASAGQALAHYAECAAQALAHCAVRSVRWGIMLKPHGRAGGRCRDPAAAECFPLLAETAAPAVPCCALPLLSAPRS